MVQPAQLVWERYFSDRTAKLKAPEDEAQWRGAKLKERRQEVVNSILKDLENIDFYFE